MIPISYINYPAKKPAPAKEIKEIIPQKHVIHKAISWRKMLDEGAAKSLTEIAHKEGLTRARVTQIMNLLRLPDDFRDFLLRLKDPREIRRYSERRLRKGLTTLHEKLA